MSVTGETLVGLLERKRDLLQEIYEDCGLQHVNISSDNLDAMEYIINRREERMRTIERLDVEFMASAEECRKKAGLSDWRECRVLHPEIWDRLNELSGEIREVCENILKQDKINAVALENRMTESRSELKQVKEGQRLNQAYFSPYGDGTRINDGY